MRRAVFLSAVILGFSAGAAPVFTAVAQPMDAAALAGGVAAGPLDPSFPPDPAVQLAQAQRQATALQQALVSAQEQLADARQENERLRGVAAALQRAEEKNQRLVAIGQELIAGYERRFGRGRGYLPFELGRRKLEAELQAAGDRIYENRADAAPAPSRTDAEIREALVPTIPAPTATPDAGADAPSADRRAVGPVSPGVLP